MTITLIILGTIVYLLMGIVITDLLDQVEAIIIDNEYERVLGTIFFILVVLWVIIRSTGHSITRIILDKLNWEY